LRSHLPIAIFLLLFTITIGYKLITTPRPFYDWDESIYIEVGKEMVDDGSLLPQWQGKPWLEKPFLAPLVYGVAENLPIRPEVSTRLLSLFLSTLALVLTYAWVYSLNGQRSIALLTSAIVAFNPIFLQRTQTVNTDVFLLVGWLGYFLFHRNFMMGLLFLFIGVYSKSVLGFYPLAFVALSHTILLMVGSMSKKHYFHRIKEMIIQCAVLSIWYIVMSIMYGSTFFIVHFQDHLLRRVTSSIESHFGARTFYIDIVVQQYSLWLLLAGVSIVLLFHRLRNDKKALPVVMSSLFLIPWFLFLNLTKTKISWYIYPFIPQIAYLLSSPLSLLNSQSLRPVKYGLIALVIAALWCTTIVKHNFYGSFYSQYDATYNVGLYARSNCSSISILLGETDRQTHDVLSSMNLLISTSDEYGNHPSLVYYSGKKVTPYYSKERMKKALPSLMPGDCLIVETPDRDLAVPALLPLKQFDHLHLYQKK
jgi:4-amino-4-deoxy-L-arabinose transferase-like glycosyltransferase